MEGFGSFWNYEEGYDELKLKVQYSAMELECVKMEANEQISKYREELKLMLNLLSLACQERDEARQQLQKLLNKLMPCETPLMIAAKTNSSITESNSLSDTYNNHPSHGSDSLFDAVTSTIKMADSLLNKPFGLVDAETAVTDKPFGLVDDLAKGKTLPQKGTVIDKPFGLVDDLAKGKTLPQKGTVIDKPFGLVDDLAKGKTLPQKGKLLQAVMEAGPLLSTLLVAGPLPQWRNPPPSDTFKIPPVSGDEKPMANSVVRKRVNSSLYPQMTHQMCSSAMLSFAGSASASGLIHSPMLSSGAGVNTQITVTKRQRI